MENSVVTPNGAVGGLSGRKTISRGENYFFLPLAGDPLSALAAFFSSFFFFCFCRSFLDIAITVQTAVFGT